MDMFERASIPTDETPEQGHVEEVAEDQTAEESEVEETEEQEQEELTEEQETDPDEGQSEKLYAGKFKSEADLEKAYMELQRQFTRQRMEERAQPPQQAQTQQQPIQHQESGLNLNDPGAIIEAINADPMGTIAKIAEMTYQQARTAETHEQQFQRGINEVAETYADRLQNDDDVQAYFAKVRDVCRDLGVANSKTPSPRILKMAAQELWGIPGQQTISKVYEQAKQKGRQEAEETRRAKAGLSAPTGAKQQQTPKSQEDIIREGIVNAGRRGGMFG